MDGRKGHTHELRGSVPEPGAAAVRRGTDFDAQLLSVRVGEISAVIAVKEWTVRSLKFEFLEDSPTF